MGPALLPVEGPAHSSLCSSWAPPASPVVPEAHVRVTPLFSREPCTENALSCGSVVTALPHVGGRSAGPVAQNAGTTWPFSSCLAPRGLGVCVSRTASMMGHLKAEMPQTTDGDGVSRRCPAGELRTAAGEKGGCWAQTRGPRLFTEHLILRKS